MDTKAVTNSGSCPRVPEAWERDVEFAWDRWRFAHHLDAIRAAHAHHLDAIRAAHGLAQPRPFHGRALRARVTSLRRAVEAAHSSPRTAVDGSQQLQHAVLTTTGEGHALTVKDFLCALAAVEARVIAWHTRGTRPTVRRGQRSEDVRLWQTLRRIRRDHGITIAMVAEFLWPKQVARKTDRELSEGQRDRRRDLEYLCPALRTSRVRLRARLERKLARGVEDATQKIRTR